MTGLAYRGGLKDLAIRAIDCPHSLGRFSLIAGVSHVVIWMPLLGQGSIATANRAKTRARLQPEDSPSME